MEIVCGVYGIFATDTGECLYVGESVSVYRRWTDHLKALVGGSHSRQDFVAWFQGKGSDSNALEFRLLESCAPEDLGARERFYFDSLQPRFFGQIPHGNRQWFQTESTRLKISESMRSRFANPEIRKTWESVVLLHGRDKAVEMVTSAGSFANDPVRASLAGKKGKGRPKSESHRASLAQSQGAPTLLKVDLKAAILESPTSITGLARHFGVSRTTMRKYLQRFELVDLLESNRSSV